MQQPSGPEHGVLDTPAAASARFATAVLTVTGTTAGSVTALMGYMTGRAGTDPFQIYAGGLRSQLAGCRQPPERLVHQPSATPLPFPCDRLEQYRPLER